MIKMNKRRDTLENKDIKTEEMIENLVKNARGALQEYMKLDQQQIDKIVKAMALAGLDHHRELAKLAVEETRKRSV